MGLFPTDAENNDEVTNANGTTFKYVAADDKWIILNTFTISDLIYNAANWNANPDAATKNAIRDKIELLVASIVDFVTEAEVNAAILATQQSIGLPFTIATGGASTALFLTQSVGGLPAADNSCQLQYQGYMPTGWEPMVNPTLVVLFASITFTDTWQITVRVDASKEGESPDGANLYNGSLVFSTVIGANQWVKKEIQLTGTISPGDIVGCRLMKTSSDTYVCYVGLMLWIRRS